jgi:hypothetical protein
MFTFFGLFADPVNGLRDQIARIWTDLKVVRIEQPITAIAVRFGQDRYEREPKDMPMPVMHAVGTLSAEYPAARFMLLRTECWGGLCENWGQVVQGGSTVFQTERDGALGRLIKYWGGDLGANEIFDPLKRDFPWT